MILTLQRQISNGFDFLGDHFSQKDLDSVGQQRQKAAPSFNIFSPKSAQIFKQLGKPKLEDLCVTIHEGMEVLTSNRWEPQKSKLHCPFGMHLELQLEALNRYKMYLELMRFKLKPKEGSKRKTSEAWRVLPFQKGALISISATILLQRDLKTCYNVPYILTEWCTQVKFHSFPIISN